MIGPKHAGIIFVVYYVMVFILGCNQAEYHRGRGTHWTISKDFSSNNLTLSWFGIYKCEGLGPHLRAFVYNAVIFLIKDVYLKYANLIHKKKLQAIPGSGLTELYKLCFTHVDATKWLVQELAECFPRSTVVRSSFSACVCVCSLFLSRGTIFWLFCSICACENPS